MRSPDAGSGEAAGGQPPYVLRAAVGLWCALAVFLLVQAAFAWGRYDWLVQQLMAQRGVTPADAASGARSLLLTNSAVAVLLASAYAGLAWLVWKGRSWARITVTVLAVLHLMLLFATAALSAPTLIVLALAVAAWACSWRRSSSEWLAGGHG